MGVGVRRGKDAWYAHSGVPTGVRLRHGEEALERVRVGQEVRAAAELEEHLARCGRVVRGDVELILALQARVREQLRPRAQALRERGAEACPVVHWVPGARQLRVRARKSRWAWGVGAEWGWGWWGGDETYHS